MRLPSPSGGPAGRDPLAHQYGGLPRAGAHARPDAPADGKPLRLSRQPQAGCGGPAPDAAGRHRLELWFAFRRSFGASSPPFGLPGRVEAWRRRRWSARSIWAQAPGAGPGRSGPASGSLAGAGPRRARQRARCAFGCWRRCASLAGSRLSPEEAEALRRRHAEHFLALAEAAEERLQGPEQASWLERLEIEHDNLRAALSWSLQEPGRAEAALRLCGALSRFWEVRGHFDEGLGWAKLALERDPGAAPDLRIKTLLGAARVAWLRSDLAVMQTYLEQALALCRQIGDRARAARPELAGSGADDRGEFDRARALGESAWRSCRSGCRRAGRRRSTRS